MPRRLAGVVALAVNLAGCGPAAFLPPGMTLVVGPTSEGGPPGAAPSPPGPARPAFAPPSAGPAAVEAAVPVREAASARAGGGAAAPVAPSGPRHRVVATVGGGGQPLAGAWVASADGRRVTTGPDGGFTWTGAPPADGTWVAGAEGHVTSVVQAYGPDVPTTLHLEPLARVAPAAPAPVLRPVAVSGEVRAADGAALPGLLVVLGAPGLAGSPVAFTGADGRFTLRPDLPDGGLPGATLLVAGPRGDHLAALANLRLTGQNQQLEPLVAVAAQHELQVQVPPLAGLPPPRVLLLMRGPQGSSLTLDVAGGVRLAPLPGVTYSVRAQATSNDGLSSSRLERPALALDWSQPRTTLTEELLALPVVTSPPRLTLGARVAWAPVSGAQGYTVEVQGPAVGQGWPWEAFTTSTEVPLLLPGGELPAGGYRVAVSAWDAPGLSARALAQVGAPRALRRIEGGSQGLRVARTEVSAAP